MVPFLQRSIELQKLHVEPSFRQSKIFYEEAQEYMPGGVNSPVRTFKGVGGRPLFIQKAEGPYLYDADGNQYIDYVCSWGPLILGHQHPAVLQAVREAVEKGLSYGASCAAEIYLAREICRLMPSIERVRFVNSGTEAAMTALRLARGATGRSKIIKFEGCYHGHVDSLLVKAGSGALTLGTPTSAGVSPAQAQETLIADFNDLHSVAQWFERYPHDIAAIIVEPIAANVNLIKGQPAFLKGLRELCDQYKSLLIFDEVITGFRVDLQGAQGLYGICPDLTLLGKIIGGGMPVGAVGGQRELMEQLAPLGPVYQAGTLSGNPVAMSAGLANLKAIQEPSFYPTLEKRTHQLMEGIKQAAQSAHIPLVAQHVGSLFGLLFTDQSVVENYGNVMKANTNLFCTFFHALLNQGVYLAPSAYEAGFVSWAHSEAVIEDTLCIIREVFDNMT